LKKSASFCEQKEAKKLYFFGAKLVEQAMDLMIKRFLRRFFFKKRLRGL